MRRFRLPADTAWDVPCVRGRKGVSVRAPLGYRTAALAAMGLMAPATLWSELALAQCTPGIFTGADETCSGTFIEINQGGLTNDQIVTFQGVTVTNTGIFISTDNADDSDLTLIFDPTVDGFTITHKIPSGASSLDGVGMFSDGGNLTLTALTPSGGIDAHDIDAEDDGIGLGTIGSGNITADSALPVVANDEGYRLRAETGDITATVRAPVAAGRNGILADTDGGDVTVNVAHSAPGEEPDILFNDGHPTVEGLVGGIIVRDRSGGGKESTVVEGDTNTITVNLWNDVTIVGVYDEADDRDYVHAGVHATSQTAKIGVILGNNVHIDPVDYGLFSASGSAGVLTRLGAGNIVDVNDLDEDGLAVGLFASSGALDDSTPYDPTYPHAVAVVTGGANEINVIGNAMEPEDGEDNIIAGIAAIATPSESGGGKSITAAEDGDAPVKSSILVSLGTHDGGDGIMAGDQITVVGDGLPFFPAKPSIYGVFANHRGEGPEDGPAITIRSGDASSDAPTHIFVGDDGIEDVTGDGSAGISAQNWGSASTLIELGAHTYVTVVDNNESVDPDNGDRPVSVANSVGIHALSGFDEDLGEDVPGGDISISLGEYNHVDVTGGYGITALYEDASETANAMVTVGAESLVRSDYSAVVIGLGEGFLGATDRPTEAHLYNSGSLVSLTKLRDETQPEDVTPIVILSARSLIEFSNYTDSYVGNAVDPALADPAAFALFADIETSTRPGEGSILVDNYGSMVGTVFFRGTPSSDVDGTLNNMGYWNFVGDTFFDLDGDKIINNGGVIHTVDIAGGESESDFRQKPTATLLFNNFAWDDGSGTFVPGMISMLDGEANDETSVTWDYDGGDFAAGYSGTVAVDAFLDVDGVGKSDRFGTRLSTKGSTAVYVENVNPGFGGWNPFGIQVWRHGGLEIGCGDTWCKQGDSAYLSPESPNYALIDDGDGGLGVIRDGLQAWALSPKIFTPGGGEANRIGLITTTYSPDRALMPSLTTTVQNIWYDTDSIVQEQLAMLNGANGPGGGGADLTAGYDFIDGGSSAAHPNNGIWLRVSGEWTEEDSTVTDGMFAFDTSFDQDTYSILVGADMKANPNSPFRFGLFGGYVKSDVSFTGYDIDTDYEGGTLGAYAAYVNGGFTIDGTFKTDLVEASYDSTAGDVNADVVNVGVRANTGYRIDGGMGFVEPVASFAYVHSEIDDMDFGPSSVDFSNGESLRAGLGARFGTAFGGPAGGTTELSLLGKLWNEFEDENTVTITGPGGTESYTDSISGLFGEVIATAAMSAADGMTSGFLSAGTEFNDDFTSYSAKVGVRRAW